MKGQLFRDTLVFSTSQYVCQFLNIVRVFLIARYLSPSAFGVWGIVTLVLRYSLYADLGAVYAMNRDVPRLIGRGDPVSAGRLEGVTFSVTLMLIAGVGGILLLYSFISYLDVEVQEALRISALLVILQQIQNYFFGYLRSRSRFGLLSLANVLFSGASTLIVFLSATHGGLTWVYIALGAGYVLSTAIVVRYASPVFYYPKMKNDMMPLLSAGFSLLVYNLAALMLLTVDRIVLANVMPLDEFGQYNFASSVFTAVLLIPGSIGLVMYTFILRTAGNDGGRRALPTIVYKSNGVLAVTTPLLLASVTLMGAEVIMRWLPQYAPALRVIHLMTVGLYFYVIPMNSIHALLALDRQKTLIVAALCGVMINILCTVGLFMVGYGMLGAAWGLIMGLAVFSVSSLVAVYKQFNLPSRSIVIKILMDFLPLAIYVVALYAVTLFNLGEGTGFHKSLVVYMAFSMPFLGFGYVYLRKYVRIDPSVMVRTWWQSRMVRENL